MILGVLDGSYVLLEGVVGREQQVCKNHLEALVCALEADDFLDVLAGDDLALGHLCALLRYELRANLVLVLLIQEEPIVLILKHCALISLR